VNNYKKPVTPDFLVQWHNDSIRHTEDVYCAPPVKALVGQSISKLRKAVATLQTSATHVEVSEVTWTEPTTLTFMPNRVGFCFLTAYSASIEYGYAHEAARSGGLGRIFFMLPGTEICGHITPGMIRTVTCTFDREYAENIVGPLDRLSQAQLLGSLDVRSSVISSIMLRLRSEALYPGPLSNAIVESFGHSMLVECAHLLLADDAAPDVEGRLTVRHFSIIEKYLAAVSGEFPSVAKLAAACGFSERYFAKLFRDQTGCSVAQYIKSAQTARAKAYLLETELPLKEIAYRLGFSTPGNFSSAFRAAMGITPGQFRKTS